MRIGVDVGGTFTDLVVAQENGEVWFVKTPSVADDPSIGVLDALGLVAQKLNKPLTEVLPEITLFIHGTTVATNILVERTGASVGLITTRGFRDLLELRDGTKTRRYRLREPFPTPLIVRERRLEVAERIQWDGAVAQELAVKEVDSAIATLRKEGVESVVVCLLHAHRNAVHELSVRRRILASGWTPYISLSHETLGKIGEYERLSTTTVNGYVGPGLNAYLERLSRKLSESGVRTPMLVMQSNGGVLPAKEAAAHAVGAVTSGPAGGAMSGVLFARMMGLDKLVTYDTGGTSTDVCIIEQGRPVEQLVKDLADTRIAVPAVDVNPLAIGGGSIARIDAGGILDVGPRSAGARPGSACFGHGGLEATLTDANVVLGYVSTETFLGGRMRLSRDAAEDAIRTNIANPLGLTVDAAALAIHAIATSRITEGIRLATVRRGADPRDYALLCFGGAGGVHANSVGVDLSIPEVIIPRHASVLSALGFLASDVRHDYYAPVDRRLGDVAGSELTEIFERLEMRGKAALVADGFAKEDLYTRFIANCRYQKQVHALPLALTPADLAAGPSAIATRFEEAYGSLYHHVHGRDQTFIESVRVACFGRLRQMGLPTVASGPSVNLAEARRGSRKVYLGEWVEAPVYWFDDLRAGACIHGPAIVDSASTTVLVQPGSHAIVDSRGSLCIKPKVEGKAHAH